MIRVAGYCRVSTDKSDQANSFESQQRYFRDYILQHPGWELHRIYADEGITGTSTRKRAQFNEMIRDALAGQFRLILTKEISRFSRNILDTVRYTRELKNAGVGVLFMTENLDTRKPETEMLLTFMGTIAQEESRRTSVRVKWGQTRQMEQGVVFGRSLLGYDVKNGALAIEPRGAELVRLIFHKYGICQMGTTAIARDLEAAGFRTMTGSPVWNPGQIVRILKNEKYVGDLVQKKTITPDYLTHAKQYNHGQEELVIIRNHHEPIVSRELWDRVQSELARRNRRGESTGGHSASFALSGKIRCGCCGSIFVCRGKKRKDGTVLRRWSCANAIRKGREGCAVGRLLRDDDAHSMLMEAILSRNPDIPQIAEQVSALCLSSPEPEELRQTEVELRRLEYKKTAAMDACISSLISPEELTSLREQYDARIRVLQERLSRTPSEAHREEIRDVIRALLSGRMEGDCFVRHILEQITVYPDRTMELRLKGVDHTFLFA